MSGFIFKVYGCTVASSSKTPTTIAKSSMSYVALSRTVSEAVWIRGFLKDFNQMKNEPTDIY